MTPPTTSGREGGQASIELVALLPVLVAVALALAQVLAAGLAAQLAGHAAEAGAVALLEGGDPRASARDAVPGWTRSRIDVRVDGRRVRVALRPVAVAPGLASALTAHATADAGPRP